MNFGLGRQRPAQIARTLILLETVAQTFAYATMLFGYARVSTDAQDAAAQIAALESAGCEMIFEEKASGGRWDRPELLSLLGRLREGHVLVVWKLDRLSLA